MKCKKLLIGLFFVASLVGTWKTVHAADPSFDQLLDVALADGVTKTGPKCDTIEAGFSQSTDAGCIDFVSQCDVSLPFAFKNLLLDEVSQCQIIGTEPSVCLAPEVLDTFFEKSVAIVQGKMTALCGEPNLPTHLLPTEPEAPELPSTEAADPVSAAPAIVNDGSVEVVTQEPANGGGCHLGGAANHGAWLQLLWIALPIVRTTRRRRA